MQTFPSRRVNIHETCAEERSNSPNGLFGEFGDSFNSSPLSITDAAELLHTFLIRISAERHAGSLDLFHSGLPQEDY